MNTIDIIIPVYNAPKELQECVESIQRFVDKTQYRIVIINDCSPDPNVKVYLDKIKDEQYIEIYENEVNLGFVGTVNRGMQLSKNDVILLNSDTIVTKNWLRKLHTAAYSHESVATVTPFTNNGTICSIPNFVEDNEVPEGFSIDSFADFIEKVSDKTYTELPTGVGFCMYIKRKVIDEIGVFDMDTFGKGYGEENDFCCRAFEHGYKNILADDTYIYHKGSMSFQGEKAKLSADNVVKLNNRYPYYEQSVHDFIHLNKPLEKIHTNIKMRMAQYRDSYKLKGNVLFLLHNFFDLPYNHPIGGTEFHVRDLVVGMNDYNCFVLVTNTREIVLKHYRYGHEVQKFRFGLTTPITLTHFHHTEYSEILEKILTTFNIDLIHIHHLMKHSLDAPRIAKKIGIPVYMTLHDYYHMCPRSNLLDQNNNYCIDERSTEKCLSCLQTSHPYNSDFITTWKKHSKIIFSYVDYFIVPSKSTANIIGIDFPEIMPKLTVIEHGYSNIDNTKELIRNKLIDNKLKSNVNQKIKIAFIGGISPVKGSKNIYDLIKMYKNNKVEWHIIGEIGDQQLNLLEQSNVIKHGSYRRENLSQILNGSEIDIIAILSQAPETFSYTLTEAWLNNIPVIVTPMGALKERVEKTGAGWITESIDVESIIKTIDNIVQNFDEQREKVLENLRKIDITSINEMVDSYIKVYQSFNRTSSSIEHKSLTNREISESLKYYYVSDGLDQVVQNSYTTQLEHELYLIKSTIGYKVLERLRRKNSWVLKIGKKGISILLKIKRRFN